jgi:hypothetical protein
VIRIIEPNNAPRTPYRLSKTARTPYHSLRHKFEPDFLWLVIVAESPPVSGKYFYDPTGALSEPLFAAMMREIGFTPTTKESGLHEFQRRGVVLVDATYESVNALSGAARDEVIVRDYTLLRDDLAALMPPDRSTKLILVKANVCQLLEPKLKEDGFYVLNNGHKVPFPSTGHQKDFHQKFGALLTPRRFITAIDIAEHFDIEPKIYRQALRELGGRRLCGHRHYARWEVEEGSPAYDEMIEIANLVKRGAFKSLR